MSDSILPKCPASQLASREHQLAYYDTPPGTCTWCGQAARRCQECNVLLELHHDPACTQPCGACEAAGVTSRDPIGDYFARNTPARLYVELDEADPDAPEATHLIPPGFLAEVRKLSAFMVVPDELLNEHTRHREPYQPSRRARLRACISDWRERLARRAYKTIAGYGPPDESDIY